MYLKKWFLRALEIYCEMYPSESSKIEPLEGRKMFSHKIISIFESSFESMCSFEICEESVKKVSKSWTMSMRLVINC